VLARLLQATGLAAQQIPAGLEPRSGLWRDRLAGKRLLLVLDDAAGHDQVQPLLPGTAGCRVLITSRRHLTALEGARAISLDTFTPAEAGGLLVRLAGRPDLDPGDRSVREICQQCGYLPLAVGMLARQLHHHPGWTAADLAADLAAAPEQRLDFMQTENVSLASAFSLSYADLDRGQQRLFRGLGLHMGVDIDVYAAAALDGIGVPAARRGLEALYDHYLLDEPSHGRYRCHDLIREYARALAATDPAATQDAAIDRLLDYYVHAACAASRHLTRRAPVATAAGPAALPELPTRERAAAWMDAEYANLTAATRFAADHRRPGPAMTLPAALNGYLLAQGHWDQALAVHGIAIEAAQQAGEPLAGAAALINLGIVQRLTGSYPAATRSFTQALTLCRSGLPDQRTEAHALNELGVTQYLTADYPAATENLTQALGLCRDLDDREAEAAALNDLGLVQQAAGQYPAAAASFTQALAVHRELGDRLWEANALNNLGAVQRLTGRYEAAASNHSQALEIYRSIGNSFGQARALSYVGVVQCLAGDYPAAAVSHVQALRLYRGLGNRAGEAEALNDLGIVHRLTGRHEESAASHEQALRLYREQGIQLGEAEVLNDMGELALASGAPAEAAFCYRQALRLAEAITAPMEQARALEGMGRASLLDGKSEPGIAQLAGALAIYQQIGSPRAQSVAAVMSGSSRD
jgi:tetratricopeptide (TPR) repeat protein